MISPLSGNRGLQNPKLLFYFSFFFFSITAYSQTPKTIEVSRQEFSTSVRSSTFDDSENAYYAGFFKGALTIESDTLLYGKGNNDLFVVKMDSAGMPVWSINIGSDQDETSNLVMHYQNNGLYLAFSVRYPFSIADEEVNDIVPGVLTSILAKLDSNGNVLWVKKFNGQYVKIHPGINRVVVECAFANTSPALFYNSEMVFAPNGVTNQLFLSIDEGGNFLKTNSIYQNSGTFSSLNLLSLSHLTHNRYYFLISTNANSANAGNNRYFIGDTSILLPSGSRTTLLIKTDSAFKLLGSKVLNQTGGTYLFNNIDASRFRLSADGGRLNILATTGTYNTDGYNITFSNSHNLITLDTSLLTLSVKKVNQNLSNPTRTHIVHVVEEDINGYTILGTVIGNNNGLLIDQIPEENVAFSITESFIQNMNINGPSQTYLLRTNKNLEAEAFTWIGKTSVYERSSLPLIEIKKKNDHLYFINNFDNTWAPWKVSKSFMVKYGGFKNSANGPDYAEHVGFFSDKSSYLIGTANGTNAFDTSAAGIVTTNLRRDVFITILNENGSPKKYHRLFSSFGNNLISRVRLVNDTLYALVVFSSSSNQPAASFFRLDTVTRLVSGQSHRALFKIDKNGGVQYLDLQNTAVGIITDFDIYENGDIAAVSFANTIALNLNGQVFPTTNGFYLARLHPAGSVKEAVKVSSSSILSTLNPLKIQLEKNQDVAGLLIQATFRNNLSQLQMVHSRKGNQESIKAIDNPMPNEVNQKNYLLTYRLSMSSNLEAGLTGPVNQSAFSGYFSQGKTNLLFINNPTAEPIKYNNQLLSSESPTLTSLIIALDSNLRYKKHLAFKSIPNSIFYPMRIYGAKFINEHFYISGNQWEELSFGALKISHKGNGDGLTLKMDTALNVLQFFKVSSPYSEVTTDFAIHTDSTFMVGYRSQTKTNLKVGLNSAGLFDTNTGSVKPSDFAEQGFVSLSSSINYPKDFIYSIKNGNWSEPTSWSTGKVPGSTDQVFIRHKVIVDVSATCFTLFSEPSGNLQLNTGIHLQITGVAQE